MRERWKRKKEKKITKMCKARKKKREGKVMKRDLMQV